MNKIKCKVNPDGIKEMISIHNGKSDKSWEDEYMDFMIDCQEKHHSYMTEKLKKEFLESIRLEIREIITSTSKEERSRIREQYTLETLK